MVFQSIVPLAQGRRTNQDAAPGEPWRTPQASVDPPRQSDSCVDRTAAWMEHSTYGFETGQTEAVGETSFSGFGSRGRSISPPPDTISIDLDDRPPAFADALVAAESIEAEQDDLAPGRGLLFALTLSIPIWLIFILLGRYLFA
jgi:hypothetical protein